MNTQNIFTIQLEQPQEETSIHSTTSNELEFLKDNTYSTISQLKKIKLSVYKEKLNLFHEKCKIKDDVIMALQACLETYKNTNLNNNDLIAVLKSRLAEKHAKAVITKKLQQNQTADHDGPDKEEIAKTDSQDAVIKEKTKLIDELEEKLREQSDLTNKCKEEIITLQATVNECEAKICAHETSIKERDSKIVQFEKKLASYEQIVNTSQDRVRDWKLQFLSHAVNSKDVDKSKLETELNLSIDKIRKQNDRLMRYTIKELQERLRDERSTEIIVMSLPRIGPFRVAIEKVTAGSRWTVIQRRIDKSMQFNQGWFSYVDGFGELDHDFWIGLDKIHALTKNQPHELYIQLTFCNDDIRYAYYDCFAIAGKSDNYKLRTLGNYFGNAGDGLRIHEHHMFRTIKYETKTAIEYNRWWQHENPTCNLNGVFNDTSEFGVWWGKEKSTFKSVESVQMLIRPSHT